MQEEARELDFSVEVETAPSTPPLFVLQQILATVPTGAFEVLDTKALEKSNICRLCGLDK